MKIDFTTAQILNLQLGRVGFDIILNNTTWTGDWYAIRLVVTTNIIINLTLTLLSLNDGWIIGLYLYGNFDKIRNDSGYAILAYKTGEVISQMAIA